MIELQARLRRPTGFTLDVALSLPSRGTVALFGPSGCGKTTLLRCLAGLDRAEQAQVGLYGERWQDERTFVPTHRRGVGVVFQDAALFPHLNVRENLAFGLQRATPSQTPVALGPIISLLGLEPLLERAPQHLSGGERQRVAIARALASSPRLMLMDEPLASLDAARKAEFLPWLDRLHDALTVPLVYVSHAMDEIARLADHLVLMDNGRILAEGPLADMTARLDLNLHHAEDAGVVLPATVAALDPVWSLARLDIGGHSLWARDPGRDLGQSVRLRVLARDVSLVLAPDAESSIGNQVPATVDAIADDAHPALAMLRVRLGEDGRGPALLARVTRRSVDKLALAPGRKVWAQVKTVALTA